jgi:hypothetical protein
MAKQKAPPEVRKYLAEIGRLGGKASLESLTPEERSARAKVAAKTRWKDARAAVKPARLSKA